MLRFKDIVNSPLDVLFHKQAVKLVSDASGKFMAIQPEKVTFIKSANHIL